MPRTLQILYPIGYIVKLSKFVVKKSAQWILSSITNPHIFLVKKIRFPLSQRQMDG